MNKRKAGAREGHVRPLRRAAGIAVITTLMLAGCGVGTEAYVQKYEGDAVDVTDCRKTGARITEAGTYPTNAEDGDSADEIWKCTITKQAPNEDSVDKCYVVHESKVETIVRGMKCSSRS